MFRIKCEKCGAATDAACECAVFLPPIERAFKAVGAHPEKSDRALADEAGVSPTTIGKARKVVQLSSGGQLPEQPDPEREWREMEHDNDDDDNAVEKSATDNADPEKRIGKDGKARRSPKRSKPSNKCGIFPEDWNKPENELIADKIIAEIRGHLSDADKH
jgi:hypothetical protein